MNEFWDLAFVNLICRAGLLSCLEFDTLIKDLRKKKNRKAIIIGLLVLNEQIKYIYKI